MDNISFPKKNIAQRSLERQRSHIDITYEPITEEDVKEATSNQITVSAAPELPPQDVLNKMLKGEPLPPPVVYEKAVREETIECHGKHGGDLYPKKLWQLHHDLDLLTYDRHQYSEKELKKYEARMPCSLHAAESAADRMLTRFIKTRTNQLGSDVYLEQLQEAMEDNTHILFALRCFIAADTEEKKADPDEVQIFHHRGMNSADFFPDSCRHTYINEEGEEEYYFSSAPTEKDEEDKYWRALNHQSDKHHLAHRLQAPSRTEIDVMPADHRYHMAKVLNYFGIEVETTKQAWEILNERTRDASIEDRILARIAYLIANARAHGKEQELLDAVRG